MWTLADKYNVLTPERAARQVLPLLKEFKPFIYKKSGTRSSVYIHFNALPNRLTHKLRVSDHEEMEKYGYKWQLRLDGLSKIRHKKDHRKYFDNIESLIKAFKGYYNRVEALNAELMAGVSFDD